MEVSLKGLLLACAFALALPLAAAADGETPAAKVTWEGYYALSETERVAYLAGLSDALDLAASDSGDERLTAIAACLHGFSAAELRLIVEDAEQMPKIKWPATASAASWVVNGMIWVCQLQLPQ